MRKQAESAGITSIAMPRIGAGYGGLSWNEAKDVIERVFADWSGTLYVYDEYLAGQKPRLGTSEAARMSA